MKTILETDRLILREYTLDDFDALYEILSDPETMCHYPKPYDENGTMRWLRWSLDNYERYGFGLWAIELKENGCFIGDCGVTMQSIDGESLPEIGYHISKAHWRRGYAKEAATAVRDWFFRTTDFGAGLVLPNHRLRRGLFLYEIYECRILFHRGIGRHAPREGISRPRRQDLLCVSDDP